MSRSEAAPSGLPGRELVACLIVFLAAFLVRLGGALELGSGPVGQVLLGDGRQYDLWAQRLAAGDWLGDEVFYQAPLYPYFLGVLYQTFGRSQIGRAHV